ncbi:MAG: acyltransferase, partial [Alphaproteobacteria bacterium]|nr:acyltransferase [Alphaproteobacteria bacterium]
QDVLRFFAYDPSSGGLRLSLTFPMHPYGDWAFFLNLVAQSWSLALELCFYLLAPFVLWRRTSAVVSIIAASVCLRLIGYIVGLDENVNFVFAAFPFEIATFLCGAVAYRAYHRYGDQLRSSIVAPAILAIIALFGFAYSSVPGASVGSIKYWGFLAAVTTALPFLFAWSANSGLDRFVGELSFPVYLLHISVFYLVGRFVPLSVGRLLVPAAIVGVAITAYVFFQRPLDRARHRLAQAVLQRRAAVSSSLSPNDVAQISGDPVSH